MQKFLKADHVLTEILPINKTWTYWICYHIKPDPFPCHQMLELSKLVANTQKETHFELGWRRENRWSSNRIQCTIQQFFSPFLFLGEMLSFVYAIKYGIIYRLLWLLGAFFLHLVQVTFSSKTMTRNVFLCLSVYKILQLSLN